MNKPQIFNPDNYYDVKKTAELLGWTEARVLESNDLRKYFFKIKRRLYADKNPIDEYIKEIEYRKTIAIQPKWRKEKLPEPKLLHGYDTIKNYAITRRVSYFVLTSAIKVANLKYKMLNFNTKQYKISEMQNALDYYLIHRNDNRRRNMQNLNNQPRICK